MNTDDLRAALDGVATKEILAQVVAEDGTAWNMAFEFHADVPASPFAVVTLSHPSLKHLPGVPYTGSSSSWENVWRVRGNAPTYEELVTALRQDAETMERWAQMSRAGGWSTHQVAANLQRASELRMLLSRLSEER